MEQQAGKVEEMGIGKIGGNANDTIDRRNRLFGQRCITAAYCGWMGCLLYKKEDV